MTTWMEKAVQTLEKHGPLTSEQFNQLTGIPLKRSASLLGRAVMYGHIVRLSKYRASHIPQLRMSAVYAAKSNDNEARR